MAIYSGFSHKKLWFSIATLNYQRVELQNPIPRFGYSTMWSRCCSSILLGSYQLRTASQNCPCRSPGVPLFQAAYSRCGPCPNYHRLLPGVDALVGWRLLVWRCLEMFGDVWSLNITYPPNHQSTIRIQASMTAKGIRREGWTYRFHEVSCTTCRKATASESNASEAYRGSTVRMNVIWLQKLTSQWRATHTLG